MFKRTLFWGGTLAGSVFFCVFFPSAHWKDTVHIIYDLTVSPVVSAFAAGVLVDGIYGNRDERWWARFALLAPALLIPLGRRFLHWDVSGHLTAMRIVAPAAVLFLRQSIAVRLIYCLPLPYVLYMRWFHFDEGRHWQSYNAVIIAVISLVLTYLIFQFQRKMKL